MNVAEAPVRSDEELIAAARAGDDEAYGELVGRHRDVAMRAARARTRNAHVAEEAVRVGFENVLSSIRRGGGPDVNVRPFLLVAVRDASSGGSRRPAREPSVVDPVEAAHITLFDPNELLQERSMIALAYSLLAERWQMVLWHADVEGRTPAEIAPLVGLTTNATSALVHRSREGLRRAYLQARTDVDVVSTDTCRGIAERLAAYVHGPMSEQAREDVDAHLRTCASCTSVLDELQQISARLAEVLAPLVVGMSAEKFAAALTAKPARGWLGRLRGVSSQQ